MYSTDNDNVHYRIIFIYFYSGTLDWLITICIPLPINRQMLSTLDLHSDIGYTVFLEPIRIQKTELNI